MLKHTKHIKRILKIALEITLLTSVILLILNLPLALAADSIPIPDASKYSAGGLPTPSQDPNVTGQDIIIEAIQTGIGYFKVLVGVVAVFFIILMGAKYVTSGGDEESVKKASNGLLYAVIAFAIISVSEEIGRIVGFFDVGKAFDSTPTGGIIGSPSEILERVHLFDKQVEVVMVFIKYFIGSLAVLMLVINGTRLIVGGGEEENVKKARNGIIYALFGLVVLYLGDILINKVFYTVDSSVYSGIEGVTPKVDLARGVEEIVGITNFIVSFIGPLLLLLLLIGGVMYLTSGGEEEGMNKAKRLIVSAIIGLIIVYGAFAIVSTVVTGYFTLPAGPV